MDESKKNVKENEDAPAPAAAEKPGGPRILARAGEAFDAERASRDLHESGLKDPERLEPTDQSFIFAEPSELKATGERGEEAGPVTPGRESLGAAQPALDLTEAPAPDIPWRARPLSSGAEPLPMGVLQGTSAPEQRLSLYDTEPGLFGPGEPWPPESEEADEEAAELVLGVKFREYGSVYFFRAGKENIKAGSQVLVESEQGLSMAEVISARRMRPPLPKIRTAEGEELEIKPILGPPGPEDIAADADNRILASGARLFCRECIRERNLDMKLVDVEVLHDRSKIIFYFTAPTRIDFRELVKDLVRNYRTRIELRQIGVRHETQMLGALGNCGMACCCRRYLRRFAPVTIKMAKEQNLFLNPAKLSGICGRLLCCLANEQENYEEFHRNCPKIGKRYQTSRGVLRVLRANLFRQSIVAVGENGEEDEFQLDSWNALEPQRQDMREAREPKPGAPGAGQPEADGESGGEAAAFMGAEVNEAELAGLAGLEEDEHVNAPRKDRPHGQRQQDHRPKAQHPQDQRPQEHGPKGHRPDRQRAEGQRQGGDPRRDHATHGRQGRHQSGEPSGPGAPRPEQRPDQQAEKQHEQRRTVRPEADKSIFGLPGSRHRK